MLFLKNESSALAYMSQLFAEAMAMRLDLLCTPYATSSKEKPGNIITFAQFEEGGVII